MAEIAEENWRSDTMPVGPGLMAATSHRRNGDSRVSSRLDAESFTPVAHEPIIVTNSDGGRVIAAAVPVGASQNHSNDVRIRTNGMNRTHRRNLGDRCSLVALAEVNLGR
jgi:hypothetical protein